MYPALLVRVDSFYLIWDKLHENINLTLGNILAELKLVELNLAIQFADGFQS